MTRPQVSLLLPVHNQADHLERVVSEYHQAMAQIQYPFEILLIPNGCTDDSEERCRRLAANFDAIRVVPSARAGWGAAVKTGIRESLGGILCYANLARTRAQDLSLIVLYAIANPGTVIKANRKIREGLHRWVGSFLYNIQCRMLFDLYCWDVNGTPKAFPRSLERLLELRSDDDLIDLEFNVVCRRENYPLLEVPIFFSRRHSGRSTTNLKSAFRLYWRAFGLWRERRLQAAHETSLSV